MKTLNKIRHSRPAKSLPQKLAFSFLALLFGFGLGVFAKFLDGLSADQIPQWLSFFDIRNFFGLPLPWVFTTLVLVLFSRTPLRAAINAFCFLSGMLLGYYLYCAVFAGFLPDWSYLSVWLIADLLVWTRHRSRRRDHRGADSRLLLPAGVHDEQRFQQLFDLWFSPLQLRSCRLSGSSGRHSMEKTAADTFISARRRRNSVYLHSAAVFHPLYLKQPRRRIGAVFTF